MKQTPLRKLAVWAIGFLCLFSLPVTAQNCIPTNINHSTFDFVCPQTCASINLQIPHIKGTSDYTVSSIPYSPYSFNAPGGVELVTLYADDIFSPQINLPFPFC